MKKLYYFMYCVVIGTIFPTVTAFCADDNTSFSISIFFSVVAIITVVLTVLAIPRFIEYIKKLEEERISASHKVDERVSMDPHMSDEIKNLPQDIIQSEQTVKTINEYVNRQVSKKVDEVTREMANRYDSLVKEKELERRIVSEKYQETLNAKKQTESVIRSIAEGLVVLNDKGEVMMLNPAAEKLLGVGIQQQVGKSLNDCITDEKLLSLSKRKSGSGEVEIELEAQNDQTKKVLRSSTAVIENEDGQTIGMVSVITDVTKQKELDAMKAKFVSSVSHELRTPIVAIRNSISIMLSKASGPITEDQEKFLVIAERNLKRLSVLIDDLLDLSKLEAKRVEIRPSPSSIDKIIHETCDTFDSWARNKEITVIRRVAKDLPEVKCDPDRITQVLTNLIGNSIKFTPRKGTVTVEASVKPGEGGGQVCEVSVSDTGMGIDKNDLNKLFSKFQQLGGERVSTDIGGTGLGLYISKELIELHGGKIWADSMSGKGAKFAFHLPLT